MNRTTQTLGGVVATAIEALGLSERDIEDRTGIPRSTYRRRIKSGNFTLTELAAIADLLDVKASDLLQWAEVAA